MSFDHNLPAVAFPPKARDLYDLTCDKRREVIICGPYDGDLWFTDSYMLYRKGWGPAVEGMKDHREPRKPGDRHVVKASGIVFPPAGTGANPPNIDQLLPEGTYGKQRMVRYVGVGWRVMPDFKGYDEFDVWEHENGGRSFTPARARTLLFDHVDSYRNGKMVTVRQPTGKGTNDNPQTLPLVVWSSAERIVALVMPVRVHNDEMDVVFPWPNGATEAKGAKREDIEEELVRQATRAQARVKELEGELTTITGDKEFLTREVARLSERTLCCDPLMCGNGAHKACQEFQEVHAALDSLAEGKAHELLDKVPEEVVARFEATIAGLNADIRRLTGNLADAMEARDFARDECQRLSDEVASLTVQLGGDQIEGSSEPTNEPEGSPREETPMKGNTNITTVDVVEQPTESAIEALVELGMGEGQAQRIVGYLAGSSKYRLLEADDVAATDEAIDTTSTLDALHRLGQTIGHRNVAALMPMLNGSTWSVVKPSQAAEPVTTITTKPDSTPIPMPTANRRRSRAENRAQRQARQAKATANTGEQDTDERY